MTGSPNLLTTIFAFLLLLGPLVLVHELGHYLVGRLFGVKANAFSIGFGKELAGWTDRRGTRWKLSALPLGGYVQFAGDMNPASAPSAAEDGLTAQERARTFHVKPLWQRALIVLAGPLTNFLVAVLIIAAFYAAYGKAVAVPEVANFLPGSPAQSAGVEIGDRIVAVDGRHVDSVTDVPQLVIPFPGRTISLTVVREGREVSLPVRLGDRTETDRFGNQSRVGELGINFFVPKIGAFFGDSAAQKAGLKVGDRIVAVGDHAVRSFDEIPPLVENQAGRQVMVTVMRAGEAHVVPVTLGEMAAVDAQGKPVRVGVLGIRPDTGTRVPVGVIEAVGLGVGNCFDTMHLMVSGIGQIFSGERSVKEFGGPIKIAKYSGEQFSLGWEAFVSFAALISINLAFINLLPIPGLDGGHLAFYAAEMVRRKPLDVRSQEWAIRTGVAFVLALMLFVTVNDLASLPIFGG
ncbi:RIP metalloprotease RseP [Novosphingobium clariflavum]|uniref:Zinc metalloprotease n=1 Tax=Novosphingobium clariflavum TaxID=2029884 RepID=A0ABV6S654_9SPHN|nr:RIP metalloprotease RseP [uncultured Novosphingobium sp.]